jgi:hypothetical protein
VNITIGINLILIFAALGIAIWSAVKNPPVLWISVVLICIVLAISMGGHLN